MNASARWIWCEDADDVNAYVNFYQPFYVPLSREAVKLYISAQGQYAVFINGQLSGFGQYADHPDHKIYQVHDISFFCAKGENTLEIRVHYPGIDSHTGIRAEPGLIFAMEQNERLLISSGPDTRCRVDNAYRNGAMSRITTQLGFAFERDEGRAQKPLKPVVPAQVLTRLTRRETFLLRMDGPPQVKLYSQGVFYDTVGDGPAERMHMAALAFRPLKSLCGREQIELRGDGEDVCFASDGGDGIYLVVDVGRETSGFLRLEGEFEEGTRVLVGYGEHLSDLRVRTHIDGRNFCVSYRAGKDRTCFTHYFCRLGGRYLQLHVYAKRFALRYAAILPVRYPVDHAPDFKCADRLHRRIYEVCRDTLANCMHEHYEDCPWREQALYAYDARLQMLAGYYVFGETRFAKESLRLLAQSLRDDCLLELCAPARIPVTIPSFSLSFVIALEEYYMYSGDAAFVREMLPVAETIMRVMLERAGPNGLIPNYTEPQYWNFYEWRDGLDGGPIERGEPLPLRYEAPLNAMYALALSRLEQIYAFLGMTAKQARCQERREAVSLSMNAFWNEERGAYAAYLDKNGLSVYAELTQALMLLSSACPRVRRERLVRHLHNHELIPVTLCNYFFKYEALLRVDEHYCAYVFEDIARRWGGMLFEGATSFWETERGQADFHWAGSLCHGWSAVPAYFYFAHALGLKPTQPGYAAYDLRPGKAEIGRIEAVVKTPEGYLRFDC